MDTDQLQKLYEREKLKTSQLEKELSEVHDELHKTNSELLQLTLEMDERIAERTQDLSERNEALAAEVKKRLHAEDESRAARKVWQDIFEAIGHMTMIIDTDFNILAANRSTVTTLGKPLEVIEGAKCYEIFHGNPEPQKECPIQKIKMDKSRSTQETEFAIKDKNYLVSCTPVYDEQDRLKNIIHIATDITKIKQLEKEILQIQKLESLGTLAGGIAHDFNNILSVILGFTVLTLDATDKQPELKDNLLEVEKAALRARDLVKQILTFARKTSDNVQPVEVNLIAKETVKMLKATTPAHIKVVDEIYGHSHVMANPTHLHQVFMNMATNSLQAMGSLDQGTLSIRTRSEQVTMDTPCLHGVIKKGKYVLIEIEDTGHGIPEEIIDNIFEPYFTTKPIGEGTGLGLAVIHGIVESCDGKITVRSEGGKGTLFKVYLPELVPPKRAETVEDTIPLGNRERVMLIDDERSIIKAVTKILQSLRYEVESELDALAALEKISMNPDKYELIITDMTMPRISGDKLAKKVKELRPGLPVILYTGFTDKISPEEAEKIGIEAFLFKPIDKLTLAKAIRQVLDHR